MCLPNLPRSQFSPNFSRWAKLLCWAHRIVQKIWFPRLALSPFQSFACRSLKTADCWVELQERAHIDHQHRGKSKARQTSLVKQCGILAGLGWDGWLGWVYSTHAQQTWTRVVLVAGLEVLVLRWQDATVLSWQLDTLDAPSAWFPSMIYSLFLFLFLLYLFIYIFTYLLDSFETVVWSHIYFPCVLLNF